MAYIARNHKWHSDCLLSSLVHDAFYRWGMWRHGEGVIQESNMGYNTAYSSLNILEDNGCTSADSTAMPAEVITGFQQTLPVRRQFLKQQMFFKRSHQLLGCTAQHSCLLCYCQLHSNQGRKRPRVDCCAVQKRGQLSCY